MRLGGTDESISHDYMFTDTPHNLRIKLTLRTWRERCILRVPSSRICRMHENSITRLRYVLDENERREPANQLGRDKYESISTRAHAFSNNLLAMARLSRANKFAERFTARSTCHRRSHVHDSGWKYNSGGLVNFMGHWGHHLTTIGSTLRLGPFIYPPFSPLRAALISRLRRRFNVAPSLKRGRTIRRTRRKIKCLARRLTSRWPGGNTRNHL